MSVAGYTELRTVHPAWKWLAITLLVLVGLALVYSLMLIWAPSPLKTAGPIDSTVAVSWGDGKYGRAFYGAHVYFVREGDSLSVRALVQIGRGNPMWHDCGEIGRAATDEEAVEKWGQITWSEQGVDFGDPDSGGYHLPRSKLEAHR